MFLNNEIIFLIQICNIQTPVRSFFLIYVRLGHAVAQAISRWLPTAAGRVRVRAGMWGLWCTKRHWGRFSPSTSVSPANHHSSNFSIILITRGWHNRTLVAAVPSGANLTPPPTIPIKKMFLLERKHGEHNSFAIACKSVPLVQCFLHKKSILDRNEDRYVTFICFAVTTIINSLRWIMAYVFSFFV
jgi:hypothetical protein